MELSRSREVWLSRVGHMLAYEAPQAVVDAVSGPELSRELELAPALFARG